MKKKLNFIYHDEDNGKNLVQNVKMFNFCEKNAADQPN